MGPAIVLGGGLILALIIAMSRRSEASEAPPPQILPIPPQGPPPQMPPEIPPGYPPPEDEYPPQDEHPPAIPPEVMPPPPPLPEIPPPSYDEPPPPTLPTQTEPLYLNSPFKQIPTPNWSKFVKFMAKGQEGTITPGGRYGLFLFSVRRLSDLGLVTNVKRGTYQGQTVWTGTWVPPYSEGVFMRSARLQYRAFIQSMRLYAQKYVAARKQQPALFNINGEPLTLSGFLAFAHLVGFLGAINSLKSKKIKPDTLAVVRKSNGIF